MNVLKGKVFFITGATSGFGRAFAKRFHALGACVIATGRRTERLASLADELVHTRIHTIELDVRDKEAVTRKVADLPGGFSDVYGLINNAGLALGLGKAPNIQLEEWEQMVDTNIKGMLNCTHALLPGMVARNSGHIVNLGSVAGTYPYPGGNVYGATKAFVRQFSLNLRADLLGKAIRVTNIEPGMAQTEFSLVRFGGNADKAGGVYHGVHPLSPEDIVGAVEYCLACPPHVNINRLEIMPTQQAFAALAVDRATGS